MGGWFPRTPGSGPASVVSVNAVQLDRAALSFASIAHRKPHNFGQLPAQLP
jgi:hypothetical protein